MGEDGALQALELFAGVQAEVVDEHVAGVLVLGQCVGLPAAAIQGEHQLRPQTLAVGMLDDQRAELGHDLAMATQREIRVDPGLERTQAQLLQPRRLGLRGRHIGQLDERRAAPERQRIGQLGGRRTGIAAPKRRHADGNAALELRHVGRLRRDLEHVPTGHRAQRQVGPECLTDRPDVHLQRRARARRRPAAP